MWEESSQPTKRANKIFLLIFLTMNATILDTHTVPYAYELLFVMCLKFGLLTKYSRLGMQT